MLNKFVNIDKIVIRKRISELFSLTSDIDYDDFMLDKFTDLIILLDNWNKVLNLTAIRNPLQMTVLHIIDSAVISPLIKGKKVADVGTGAGFPGLVLAVLNPKIEFTLIDSVGKKLSFVRNAAVKLKLNNVKIINDRCENIVPDEKFDCIVSRAFSSLSNFTNWCKNLVKSDGMFLAMKSKVDKDEINDLPHFVKISKIVDLRVPGLDAKRTAIIINPENKES